MEKLRKTNATPQPGVDGGSAGGDGRGSNRNGAALKLPSVTTSQQEAVSVFVYDEFFFFFENSNCRGGSLLCAPATSNILEPLLAMSPFSLSNARLLSKCMLT